MAKTKNLQFAKEFEALYKDIYTHAMRRVRDKRHRLSPATIGFLNHLAMTGPMTLSELAVHFDRAQSILSEMIDHLETKSFVEKQKDPDDGRKSLIWLTELGQTALSEAQTVLDIDKLAFAAQHLAPEEQVQLANLLGDLRATLSKR
ncbi:MarR family transcriptional regulator [Pseudovibrio sp. Tun.PSC04-5.I4]|uniref:MarR family winged helix-turn-helix transcriptional regulator n=1 Tax=Pseudovibrio sp. Tun.PSC04-5.I4 TaxID=1798213 RepID=UPI00088BB79C|nr:MarR family transcriptional regulator [Pseudovibrio sp. Tun.PSC04-5.I4]SDR36394.1 DNA-binding transcriptional regulator, MarR family [Pseudovibrio sp. Tun.PSC04-5.I4]